MVRPPPLQRHHRPRPTTEDHAQPQSTELVIFHFYSSKKVESVLQLVPEYFLTQVPVLLLKDKMSILVPPLHLSDAALNCDGVNTVNSLTQVITKDKTIESMSMNMTMYMFMFLNNGFIPSQTVQDCISMFNKHLSGRHSRLTQSLGQ